ncbi:MAG: FKBP-type peptidyl-prolyl cis-trans isomerase [Bacteriovoracaceae bacterium]|nr:FKBP-type peptidyl-prolyl cis-trans isomerase [Bacteriovoracaceae bacterium]
MKKIALILIAGALFSCNKQAKVSLSSDELKTFYTVGHTMGQRMKNLNLSDDEIAAVNMGLTDAAKGTKEQVNPDEYRVKIQALFKERMTKAAQTEKDSGKSFLEKFSKEKDVVTTESGLAYKILSEGKGAKPAATETVKVHYHGTLTDGTVFDSSKERGQPVTFPLNRVIKGWTEGVQQVKEGGKIKLVIPSELAYGDSGAPPKIPGGATLVFEVELLEIVKEEKKK